MTGVHFVIVPCLAFALVYIFTVTLDSACGFMGCLRVFIFTFNPFSAAIARLGALIWCLKSFKKLWRGERVDCDNESEETTKLLNYTELAPFFQAISESTPQFIAQLYIASVQKEPVKAIQMISLPVSLPNLAWTFMSADEFFHGREIDVSVKQKLIFLVNHLILLSSRLLAICYFIMSFKWWISSVLILHNVFMVSRQDRPCDARQTIFFVLFFFLHWLRDDLSVLYHSEDTESHRTELKRVLCLANALFAGENLVMIMLFYFSQSGSSMRFSNNYQSRFAFVHSVQ